MGKKRNNFDKFNINIRQTERFYSAPQKDNVTWYCACSINCAFSYIKKNKAEVEHVFEIGQQL